MHLSIEKVTGIIEQNVLRNKLKKYNKVSDIVLGLVNYRVMNHASLRTDVKIIGYNIGCF